MQKQKRKAADEPTEAAATAERSRQELAAVEQVRAKHKKTQNKRTASIFFLSLPLGFLLLCLP